MTEMLTGTACSDVTGRLYERIYQIAADGKNAAIVVPDQFVFETEKALFRKCSEHGRTELFPNIRVLTIARLSDDIVTKFTVEKPPADDITKAVIMYNAVRNRGVQLNSLGKIARKPGFASKMVKTVSLFKTAGIDCAKLGDSLEEENFTLASPSLLEKIKDIYALYLEYDQMLSQNYTDKLDVTMRAAVLASQNPYFEGMNIFVDGFNTFSGSQRMLLKAAAERAELCCFAFVCDKNDPRDIFRTVLADIDALSGGDGISEPDFENSRHMSPGIKRASELVYGESPDPEADMSSVRIIRADDIYCEMDFIAAEIKRLTSDEGLRFSDIAVLCSNPSEYRSPVESAFSKYGIPMFCDIPEVILNAPLTNLVLSMLRALDEPSAENLLSYVRSSFLRVRDGEGFRALSFADIDCFDGYIFKWQLHGDQLRQEFITDKMNKADSEQAVQAEEVRQAAVVPLLELRNTVLAKKKQHECTGAWFTETICSFLFTEAGIENAVLSGDDSCRTLWDILVGIFEAMHSALGKTEISPAEYYALFRDICAETTLARPPQVADCVIVGDTGRTRADGIKAVFIAGANYGLFPDDSSSYGLFSNYEAELLGDSGLKIALRQDELYHSSRYQAYRALTLATDLLYITYPLLNTACSALAPSEAVTELLGLFPQIREENAADPAQFGDEFYCRSRNALRGRYASLFGTTSGDRRSTLKRALELSGDSAYAEKLDMLVTERPSIYRHRLSPETSEKLFRSAKVSATKLEKLNKCRFEYFCQFGLKIKERRTLNTGNSDVGSAVHYVLEKTLSEYCTKMDKYFALSREELTEIAVKYLQQYADENLGGSAYRTQAFNYMYSGLSVSCADMLVLLQNEFKSRRYRPVLFELQFKDGNKAELPDITGGDTSEQLTFDDITQVSDEDNESEALRVLPLKTTELSIPPLRIKLNDRLTVAITGIVDRADMFRSEGGNEYIRIVDYKTGGHSFKLSNAMYGVNTQMLVYLIALCDANPNVYPGGVSYLTAKMTEASPTESGLLALLANGHLPSDMCVADEDTRMEMEQFAERYARAVAAPADSVNAKKLMPKDDAQPTPAQFEKLRKEILEQTENVLKRLYKGDIQAVPTIYTEEGKAGQQKSCMYCRYKAVCGNQDLHGVVVDEEVTERKLGISKKKKAAKKGAENPEATAFENNPAVPETKPDEPKTSGVKKGKSKKTSDEPEESWFIGEIK